MDDFPAGPASPGPRGPTLSVVVPVRDGGDDLGRCLRGLRDSTWVDCEWIVVDDGSADASATLAESLGARVVRQAPSRGPAAARNAGAKQATAPIVFFLDSDVVLHPNALARAVARFEADPGLAALFGSYDDAPAAPGIVSRFRNLLHHYVHQQGAFVADARPVHTFWTGCGAIRRDVFLSLGGFDPRRYRRPAIEDIELGYRLHRAGHRVVLARDVQATHLKRWTLRKVVRTDIFQRGVPWTLLMLRERVAEGDLNVSGGQKLCVVLTALAILSVLAAPWAPVLLGLATALVAMIVAINRGFYRFLARRSGWGFAAAAVPLHLLYYVCCGLSVVLALAIWHLQARSAQSQSVPVPGRLDPGAMFAPRRSRTAGRSTPTPGPFHRPSDRSAALDDPGEGSGKP